MQVTGEKKSSCSGKENRNPSSSYVSHGLGPFGLNKRSIISRGNRLLCLVLAVLGVGCVFGASHLDIEIYVVYYGSAPAALSTVPDVIVNGIISGEVSARFYCVHSTMHLFNLASYNAKKKSSCMLNVNVL